MALHTSDRTELNKSHWMKTCPNCSAIAKVRVFKVWPDEFGTSDERVGETQKQVTGTQSWCIECRAKK